MNQSRTLPLFLRHFFVAITILLSLSIQRNAQARGLYFDVGVGASQIRSGTNLFSGLSKSPSIGFAFNFGLLNNFMSASSFLQIHLGIKHYYTSSSEGNSIAGLHIPYAVIRFEMPRLYLTFGASPIAFTRFGSGIGIDGLQMQTGNIAVLAELGLLWRITDFFHLALEFSGQTLIGSNGLSPMPAAAATFQMRFFLVEPKSASVSSRKFDGWRYPFGIRLN